jgi:FkbM family methyltransferase
MPIAVADNAELKPAPPWAVMAAAVLRRLPRGKSRLIEWLFRESNARFLGRTARELGGHQFDCSLRDTFARQVFFAGCAAAREIAFLRSVLQPGMAFVDVGAHWGLFTLVAAHLVGNSGRVVGLEPDPRMFAKLHGNVERNSLRQALVFDVAAADRDAHLVLTGHDHGGENWGISRLAHDKPPGVDVFNVASRRLDALLDEVGVRKIDLLKVDVEGAEDLVLTGMKQGLEERRYRRILLELHPMQLAERGLCTDDVMRLLAAKAYKGYALDPSPRAMRRAYYHPWAPFCEYVLPLERGMQAHTPHTIWLSPDQPSLM